MSPPSLFLPPEPDELREAEPVETLYVSRHACSRTTISRGVFSFSTAVLGTLGIWGTSEESTRERLAVLALAAAAADEEEDEEATPFEVDEGIVVTGLGGRA